MSPRAKLALIRTGGKPAKVKSMFVIPVADLEVFVRAFKERPYRNGWPPRFTPKMARYYFLSEKLREGVILSKNDFAFVLALNKIKRFRRPTFSYQ